jgi:hypothetical protein
MLAQYPYIVDHTYLKSWVSFHRLIVAHTLVSTINASFHLAAEWLHSGKHQSND